METFGGRFARIVPVLLGATSFAVADVLSKYTLKSGADVLTVSTARSVLGFALLSAWLALGTPLGPLSVRSRSISLGLGVLFTCNIFLLFLAIERVEVPLAILTYFVYPLLTGFVAAATGVEALSWRGVAAALAAFCGLALMIGAHPAELAIAGIVAALAAACCRVGILIVTRVYLQGVDPRSITWNSLLASTVIFSLASLFAQHWQPPATAAGWVGLVALSIATTAGVLAMFASTGLIGPFRTALFMNLEPPLVFFGSALLLDEVVTPLQALGGAIMVGALVAFQVRR